MRLHDVAKGMDSELNVISEEDLLSLHKILLLILDDLLGIFKRYDLHFVMIGGTAIGALRHQGFIPWDDDIDIAMPRKDFDKLTEVIDVEYPGKYSILNPSSKNNYGRVIPKICLKGTEYRTVLGGDLKDCGIFFDVYIIENIPNNHVALYLQGFMAMFCGYALSCRRLYSGRKRYKKITIGLEFKFKSILGFLFSFASLETWAQWTNYWHSCCKDNSSKLISIPADGKHYFGGIQPRNKFCDYKEVLFENRCCYVPGNYDEYLKGYYGDYMQLPPPEKQERSKYIAFSAGKYKNLL